MNLLAPRGEFPFGTDQLGRDVMSRVVYGGRTSLVVAGLTGLLVASIGTSVGAVSGYYGGWVDQALMRFTDLILSLPLLPVAIVAAQFFRGLFRGREALSPGAAARLAPVGLAGPHRAGRVPVAAREGVRRGGAGGRAPATAASSSATSCPTPWARSS